VRWGQPVSRHTPAKRGPNPFNPNSSGRPPWPNPHARGFAPNAPPGISRPGAFLVAGGVRLSHTAIGYAEKWIDSKTDTYVNTAKAALEAFTALIVDARAGRQIKG